MTNEKVFNYVGTSANPLATYFASDSNVSYIYFIDGSINTWSFTFDVFEDKRFAYSNSNKQGYYIGKDQNGKNMIIGAPDGGVPIKILEVYEIN